MRYTDEERCTRVGPKGRCPNKAVADETLCRACAGGPKLGMTILKTLARGPMTVAALIESTQETHDRIHNGLSSLSNQADVRIVGSVPRTRAPGSRHGGPKTTGIYGLTEKGAARIANFVEAPVVPPRARLSDLPKLSQSAGCRMNGRCHRSQTHCLICGPVKPCGLDSCSWCGL